MSGNTPISLSNFFIYNSTFGPREGEEHKKILFYHPPDVDIDTQIKNIGLCEAIVKFTETFSPDKKCRFLHTLKRRQLFFEPEPEFWMVLTVNVPTHAIFKDGQWHTEYHSEDIQDNVFQTVLQQAYQMFRLFQGTFSNIFSIHGAEKLLMKFNTFFSRYLPTIKFNNVDILDIVSGIQFLPLDKNTFLKVQCFINRIESTFRNIKYTVFLYNDHLVWSGLEQEDIQILYKYLITSLFPNYLESELQLGGSTPPIKLPVITPASPTPFSTPHFGKFISGPPNMNDTSNLGKIRKVWVNGDGSEKKEYYLIIYRALSASVCLLIDSSFNVDFEFFKSLDFFLGPDLTNVASVVSEQYSKRPVSFSDSQYKFIYFNHMNLAFKSTIHNDNKKTGSINIPFNVMKLITDLHTDLTRSNDAGEVIVKTMSDYWIVGKVSDQREFYIVLNQKGADIIEINEEVKKLCNAQFNNIFFNE